MNKAKSKGAPTAMLEWQLLANMTSWLIEKTRSAPESGDLLFIAADIEGKASLHVARLGNEPMFAFVVGTNHNFGANWHALFCTRQAGVPAPLIGVFDVDGGKLFEFAADDQNKSPERFADLLLQNGVERCELRKFFDAPHARIQSYAKAH